MPIIIRPTTDITDGTWTDQAGGTDLRAALDETVADDSDYIQSFADGLSDICEIKFSSVADPLSSTDHIVRYRYARNGPAREDLTVCLMQGATIIKQWNHTDIDEVLTSVSQTLSGTEADSITDYTDLRLRIKAETIDYARGAVPVKIASGIWIDSMTALGGIQATLTIVPNTLYAQPIWVPWTQNYSSMAFSVNTAGVAGSLAWIGLYAMGNDGLPSTLLQSHSTGLSTATTGQRTTSFTSVSLSQGWYYTAFVTDGAPAVWAINSTCAWRGADPSFWTSSNGALNASYTAGVVPSTFPAVTGFSSLFVRVGLGAA
jgi:hypothetical protein